MSCCHHQCCPKKRAVASPTNSLASVISFTLFITKGLRHWCQVGTSWSYRKGARFFCGMLLLCAEEPRDKEDRLFMCSLKLTAGTGTHISVHRQRYVLELREMHIAFCLVPLGGWELRLGRVRQLPSQRAPAAAHPECGENSTDHTLSPSKFFTEGVFRGDSSLYCGVVPPCWQGFSLHLKQKWKAA